MTDKIESIIGFAVRAGKVIYGLDNIETMRKKRYIFIACNTMSERSKQRLERLSSERKIPLLTVKYKSLEEIIYRTNCKVIAITDKQMSEAVMKYLNDNYEVFTSEVK